MLYVNTFEKIYENTYFVVNFLKLQFAKILKTKLENSWFQKVEKFSQNLVVNKNIHCYLFISAQIAKHCTYAVSLDNVINTYTIVASLTKEITPANENCSQKLLMRVFRFIQHFIVLIWRNAFFTIVSKHKKLSELDCKANNTNILTCFTTIEIRLWLFITPLHE